MASVSCGIVGLANVGKSTLFNALLKKSASAKASAGQAGHAKTANYPFTTIEPNVGVVEVPDARLEKLAEVIARDSSSSTQNDKGGAQNDKREWVNGKPPIVPAAVRFVDIAGLVRGAHKGEGLGNQFLSHIREVNVIVFVLREFSDENVIKTGENPKEDLEVLTSELLLKDLETIEKRIGSLERETKGAAINTPAGRQAVQTKEVLQKAKALVESGKWLADELDEEELERIGDLQLLSAKKVIVVVNSDEENLGVQPLIGVEPRQTAIRICAKTEEELVGLTDEEQREYLKELGANESGLETLIKKAYETLDLMSFYTAGAKEVRAWTIKAGSFAPQAAGVIHTDFERGFIAADTVPYEKFIEVGGWQAARAGGVVKTIGKSEVMPEDVIAEFKFSV